MSITHRVKKVDGTAGDVRNDPRAFPYGLCVAMALGFGIAIGWLVKGAIDEAKMTHLVEYRLGMLDSNVKGLLRRQYLLLKKIVPPEELADEHADNHITNPE